MAFIIEEVGGDRSSSDFIARPASPEFMLNANEVEHTGYDEVNEVVNTARVIVEAWRCGYDDGVPGREFGHVLKVNGRIGCFTGNDDEFASLLHGDDGRACHEIVGDTGSEFTDGGSRARADDNGVDFSGA